MSVLDIFNTDAFSLLSMTDAITKMPFKPERLGEMGLFTAKGITQTTAVIEEKQGVLSLLMSKLRGEPGDVARHTVRKARSFLVPHIPFDDRIVAADIQDVRKFGSESEAETVASVVNDQLLEMRAAHEVTLEYMRIGAIHGKILDGDGSTELFDLFTEFDISEPSAVDFLLGTDTTQVGVILEGVRNTIEDALGAARYDHIHCLCSRDWFKSFINHPEVQYAYQYYEEARALREDMRAGFAYKGVVFEVYHGSIGGTEFIPQNGSSQDTCRFFPVGVRNLFVTYFAPADFIEAVNTIGVPIYAKQKIEDFERGVKIHTQSNPLPLCTRPGVLVGGYTST